MSDLYICSMMMPLNYEINSAINAAFVCEQAEVRDIKQLAGDQV